MKLIIHTDGGARGNPGPAAAGVSMRRDNNEVVAEFSKALGVMTNNQAEYMGVIVALKYVLENLKDFGDIDEISMTMDSELVVRQLMGQYKVKNTGLIQLKEEVERLIGILSMRLNGLRVEFVHVKRHLNKRADELLNEELDKQR